jgi:hypothetical protein
LTRDLGESHQRRFSRNASVSHILYSAPALAILKRIFLKAGMSRCSAALFENGPTLKEAQELARHITPHLTTNVYATVRDER